MRAVAGDVGASIIAAAVMLTTFGCIAAGAMCDPRVIFAMARDGLFFRAVGKVHPRFETPHVAVILCGSLAIIWVWVRSLRAACGAAGTRSVAFLCVDGRWADAASHDQAASRPTIPGTALSAGADRFYRGQRSVARRRICRTAKRQPRQHRDDRAGCPRLLRLAIGNRRALTTPHGTLRYWYAAHSTVVFGSRPCEGVLPLSPAAGGAGAPGIWNPEILKTCRAPQPRRFPGFQISRFPLPRRDPAPTAPAPPIRRFAALVRGDARGGAMGVAMPRPRAVQRRPLRGHGEPAAGPPGRRSLAQPAAAGPGGVAVWRPGNLLPGGGARLLRAAATIVSSVRAAMQSLPVARSVRRRSGSRNAGGTVFDVASRLNSYINDADVNGLTSMMTDDHSFTDSGRLGSLG